MSNSLSTLYDPEEFRKSGHALVDLLADHLANAQNQVKGANNWNSPEDNLEFWSTFSKNSNDPVKLFQEVVERSIHLHHPKYMGHQVVPPAPAAALAAFMGAFLNNGMAVYEMGNVSSAMEKIVTDRILDKVGWKNGDGFLTSGGTLANLTALLAARQAMVPNNPWKHGTAERYGVMVSSEAHYCVDRAIRIMGWGEEGLVSVPVNEQFHIDTSQLAPTLQSAKEKGITIIAIVGSAPSTSTGNYDDLNALADFAKQNNLWFHVDGAHGGAAIYSDKYRHLLRGMERAHSAVIDAHKMMLTPALTTFVLFKEKSDSYANFNQKAQYLWENQDQEEWYNIAKRTVECTKHMMSLRLFTLSHLYGESIFGDFVDTLYDLGRAFAQMVESHPAFELACDVHSNIVCFRWYRKNLSTDKHSEINAAVRKELLKEGEFYIVQTNLKGATYLRVTLMNCFTTKVELQALLDEIEARALKKLDL